MPAKYLKRAAVLVAFCLAACSRGTERMPVTGTVAFKSQPLESGMIQFLPGKPDNPYRAGAIVKDGKFEVPRDSGLVPGTYKVTISSPKYVTNPAGADRLPIATEQVPPRYNSQTTLTVEVKDTGANEFTFTIE